MPCRIPVETVTPREATRAGRISAHRTLGRYAGKAPRAMGKRSTPFTAFWWRAIRFRVTI